MRPTFNLRFVSRAVLAFTVGVVLPIACVRANDDSPPPPPVTPPGLADCGMDDASIPDFTLTDDNTFSPTHGQSLSLSDYSGKILLIFWMRAT